MADTYANYAALSAAHQIGVDYQLLSRVPQGSRLAHVAIHGGDIEPGTLELAEYLAGSDHLYYAFDGMLGTNSAQLSINSINFDEPTGLAVQARADYSIAYHASSGSVPQTYVGGLDTGLANQVAAALSQAGFTVTVDPTLGEGDSGSASSFTNKNTRGMGVQLELSTALIATFFDDDTTTAAGRTPQHKTTAFYVYAQAVASALAGLDVPKAPPNLTSVTGNGSTKAASSGLPGDFGIPTLAPLYVDGMPLQTVSDTLRLMPKAADATPTGERFWSSPPQANGNPLREVFEWSVATARLVNQVTFSLARFPQRAWLQYQDAGGIWRPMTEPGGSPIQITITDSIPDAIPSGVADASHLHPQHFGAGHWMMQDLTVEPVTSSRFRLIMTRIPSTGAPRGLDGSPVAYSLGVKDAQIAYRLISPQDLPNLPQADESNTVAMAQGQDLLGSQVNYLVRRNRAASVLKDGGVWRCPPQPVPNAVVCLYLDLRTAEGEGQVVDRLDLQPLTPGPSVNLYYAATEPSVNDWASWRVKAATEPLSFPQVRRLNDGVKAAADGIFMPGVLDGVEIDNQAIQFDPCQPFLLAGIVQPQFTSADAGPFTLLDNGTLKITLSSGSLSVALGDSLVVLAGLSFGFNASVPFAVAYDGGTLSVRTPGASAQQDGVYVTSAIGAPPVLRLGRALDGSPGGQMRMAHLFLARGRAAEIETVEGYWDAPSSWALWPGGQVDPVTHTSANAILVLDGSLVTVGDDSVCPLGLAGGPAVDYADMVWTPINGDFTLQQQAFTFHSVKARWVKCEFTNLQPTLVNLRGTPVVKVNLFPDSVQSTGTVASPATESSTAAPPGVKVAVASQGYTFADVPQAASSPYAGQPYLPTEALYAPDPVDAARLRASGQPFNYLPLPSTSAAPRWTTVGVHRYHVLETALDTKTAYAVAVARVHAYRSDPSSPQDNAQYVERFHDTSHLEDVVVGSPRSWVATGGALIAPPQVTFDGVTATSITYVSKTKVMGVQIATAQSEAVQLVADPDFNDPTLRYWRPYGDASLQSTDTAATGLGQMARVVRGHALSSWAVMQARFATWGDIEGSNPDPYRPSWSELEQSSVEADSGGIESVRGVDVAPSGRLFAAARVFADKAALTAPLTLQLVNGDGTVLVERTVQANTSQVTEWYVDYNVHGANSASKTWANVEVYGAGTWADVEAKGTWGDVAGDYAPTSVYGVKVRLLQRESYSTDAWLVDSLAIFNDPIVWEVSRDGGANWEEVLDVRNNPRGVIIFPDLPSGDLTGGMQLKWRVTSYAPGVEVSSVALRPWYSALGGPVPYIDALQAAGAATSLADFYPPIALDPHWQMWGEPIPQWWWLVSQQWRSQIAPLTQAAPAVMLPDTITVGTNEGAPPAVPSFVMTGVLTYP